MKTTTDEMNLWNCDLRSNRLVSLELKNELLRFYAISFSTQFILFHVSMRIFSVHFQDWQEKKFTFLSLNDVLRNGKLRDPKPISSAHKSLWKNCFPKEILSRKWKIPRKYFSHHDDTRAKAFLILFFIHSLLPFKSFTSSFTPLIARRRRRERGNVMRNIQRV